MGQEPCGRLSFLREPKTTKGLPQTAICNLNITLPTHKKVGFPCLKSSTLLGHVTPSTCKWIEILSWHREEPLKFIWSRDDCLLLVSFISVKACASHKTPQRTHAATHAICALFYFAWLAVGTNNKKQTKIIIKKKQTLICLFVVLAIDRVQETKIILLLLSLFCCLFFINPKDFIWCLLLFLLLHSHSLNFVSTSPLTITSLLFPLYHLSTLLQRILEYRRIWSLILMMR